MKPHSTLIRRILPHALPVSVGLLAISWMLLPSSGPSLSTATSVAPEVSEQGHSKSPSLAEKRGEHLALIEAQKRADQAPLNPEVAELLRKFRDGDRLMPLATMKQFGQSKIGKHVAIKAAGMDFAGTVDSKKENGGVVLLGMKLDDEMGRFQMSLREDGRIVAALLFNGETHALSMKGFPENGTWKIDKVTVSEVFCAPAGSTYPLGSSENAALRIKPESGNGKGNGHQAAPRGSFKVPDLSSQPDSTYVLYIDFDGEVVTNPFWNDGETINAEASSFADDEDAIRIIWQRVTEDYIGFDLNVTTNRALYDSTPPERRQMCVMTTTQFFPFDLAGVAGLSSFGQEINCWGFDDFNIGDDAYHGETISHEVGHTVGLEHDGNSLQEYYPGQGTGPTSWAPIMGDYSQDVFQPENNDELTTWSKGEYTDANNQEDDLQIITTQNGFGYRLDDKGNSQAEATAMVIADQAISDSGIIGQTGDVDWFSFSTSGGEVTINANSIDVNSDAAAPRGSNLAISLELYDAAGKVLQTANPPDAIDASITSTLAAGVYYIKLDGVGKGTAATGFAEYGSIGQYTLTGTVPQVNLLTVTPAESTFTKRGGKGQFEVKANSTWSWAGSETWVTSTEALNQKGKQTFDFVVEPNATRATRTALLTLTAPGSIATHLITQEASDDHGDTIDTATLVGQKSVTDGELEEERDLDVFRINVRGFGNLTVRTTGTTDTYGELLNFNGERITADDSAVKPNFKIVQSVAPGTYYIRVRHALEVGTGKYKLVCLFEEGPALTIEPKSRTVAAAKGTFSFDVVSNTTWRWSTNSSWLEIKESKNQRGGQIFEYSVLRNTSQKNRSATIVFEAGGSTVIHTVNQNAPQIDDHPDTFGKATVFATNAAINGELESQGDRDLFRIRLATSGELNLSTLGFSDTYGELINSRGRVIAFNDDLGGGNFGITQAVNAGTYYVAVRHFKGSDLGSYRLVNSFNPSSLINLNYSAGNGGYLAGDLSQTVRIGGSGRKVTAVSKPGYAFQQWSDGVKAAIRTDKDARSHVKVVGIFVRTMSVRLAGGDVLRDNQIPPVDFGVVRIDDVRRLKFEIRNNSSKTLTGLKVRKSGPNPEAWSLTLPTKTLKPGSSVILTATLEGDEVGSKLAVFAISAQEAIFKDFRIQAMGVVDFGSRRELEAIVTSDRSGTESSPGSRGHPTVSRLTSKPEPRSIATSESWLSISPDGVFRYRFFRSEGYSGEPELWLSSNGETWRKAEIVSVRRVGAAGRLNEFEAVLTPLAENGLVMAVSESPHDEVKP